MFLSVLKSALLYREMKKSNLILVIAVISVCLRLEASAVELYQKQHSFKSAVIHYEIKGNVQNGTEELYIKGDKTCSVKHLSTNILDRTEKQDLMVIDDGTNVYSIDLNKKTAIKMLSPKKLWEEMTPKERKTLEESGQAVVKGISGKLDHKPIGAEKILGKPCKIYEIFGVKSWQWEDIPLKTEMQMMGKIRQIAVSIKLNAAIPDSRFRIPAGIKIQDITEQQKNLLKTNFLENLDSVK